MENHATKVITALGGTSAVAKLIHAPISTVHSWKDVGRIPRSRLEHLKLAAGAAGLDVLGVFDEHDAACTGTVSEPSCDNAPENICPFRAEAA